MSDENDESRPAAALVNDRTRSIGVQPDENQSAKSRVFLFAWREAVAASELSSTQKLVAFILSLHMNGEGGSCFPSQTTIAAESSLGIRAVRNAVKTLEAHGFVRRVGGRHRGDVTHYAAHVPIGRRHLKPPSENKAALDDTEGGTSFHERRHQVPTRKSGGRPEGGLRPSEGDDRDAVAPDGRSGSITNEEGSSTVNPPKEKSISPTDEATRLLDRFGISAAEIEDVIDTVSGVQRFMPDAVVLLAARALDRRYPLGRETRKEDSLGFVRAEARDRALRARATSELR